MNKYKKAKLDRQIKNCSLTKEITEWLVGYVAHAWINELSIDDLDIYKAKAYYPMTERGLFTAIVTDFYLIRQMFWAYTESPGFESQFDHKIEEDREFDLDFIDALDKIDMLKLFVNELADRIESEIREKNV